MSITSEGLIIIIRAPDSRAIARAKRVFPVPLNKGWSENSHCSKGTAITWGAEKQCTSH
jgi:hypothetical protein